MNNELQEQLKGMWTYNGDGSDPMAKLLGFGIKPEIIITEDADFEIISLKSKDNDAGV